MSAHPLTTYVYEIFGQQFGNLLLIGYGAEPGGARRRLYLTESVDGAGADRVINLVASRLPCRNEPLVLAAVLKLLLGRPSISQYLKFELGELIETLQWQDDAITRKQTEMAIGNYVRLLYEKQVDVRTGRRELEFEGGGYYHLLTGYIKGLDTRTRGAQGSSTSSVYFDTGFIQGLARGRVYFAGIDFGPIHTTL
jgi:hypothetical protein